MTRFSELHVSRPHVLCGAVAGYGGIGLCSLANYSRASWTSLNMTPMQIRQLKLNRPSEADCRWLGDTLDRVSAPRGAHVDRLPGGSLKLRSD
jgi:hypothetical protein